MSQDLEARVRELETLIKGILKDKGQLVVQSISFSDDGGKERLRIGVENGKHPRIRIYDKNHHTRVLLSLESQGPGIALYDHEGKLRVTLALSEDNPLLNIFNREGQQVFSVHLTNEQAILLCRDEKGSTEVRGPLVWIHNNQDRSAITITTRTPENPVIQIVNEYGEPLWKAPE